MAAMSIVFRVSWDCVKTKNFGQRKKILKFNIFEKGIASRTLYDSTVRCALCVSTV